MEKEIRERRVSEYVNSDTPVVSSRTSVQEALRIARGHGISALPVCEDGRFIGLVREKDLLEMTPSRATSLSVHEITSLLDKVKVGAITKMPPAAVASDMSLRETAELMVKHSSEILPVLENDLFAGLISWRDLLEAAMESPGMRVP